MYTHVGFRITIITRIHWNTLNDHKKSFHRANVGIYRTFHYLPSSHGKIVTFPSSPLPLLLSISVSLLASFLRTRKKQLTCDMDYSQDETADEDTEQ